METVGVEMRKTRKFCCEYFHDGGRWALVIHAYDREDAEARVKKLGNLRLLGEIGETWPVRLGLLARTSVWIRNAFGL